MQPPRCTVWENAKFVAGRVYRYDRVLLLTAGLHAASGALAQLVPVLMPKYVIEGVRKES